MSHNNKQHVHASRFLKMMLSWDYSQLWEAYREGRGVVDDLPTLPITFTNVQVRSACPVHVHLTLKVGV